MFRLLLRDDYKSQQIFGLDGFAFAVNYGLNKVRFPSPVPAGPR